MHTKLDKLKEDLLYARKKDQKVAKTLLSTFIGEIELKLKGENPQGINETVEALAKKFTKDAMTINNEESAQEIKILNYYLPLMASESEVMEFLKDKDLSLGGRLIGEAKKHFGGKVDPQMINKLIKALSVPDSI